MKPPLPWTRRRLLRLGASLAFAPLLNRPSACAAGTPPRTGTARSVIQIWIWGGLSHLDTFDPKPDAGEAYCGPLVHPLSTKMDGVRIGELLPGLAQRSDAYSLIRSMTHGSNAHEVAAYVVQSGWPPGREVHPCLGAVVSRLRGYDAGYASRIPPYVVLCEALGRFSESGFLGRKYAPFATGGDPAAPVFAVDGIVSENLTAQRQAGRRKLLEELDTLGHALPGEPVFKRFDQAQDQAYEMVLGDAGAVFDLTRETKEMRDHYGRNTFGQSCLAARRLVEVGVPYVTVNFRGWDTHKRHFEAMKRKLPELDQGLSALLDDLAQRGLLDSTVVWCSGEFGRTPKVLKEAPWSGGRGHFGACFSSLIAGGGFLGGRVVGASDATGENVASRPVRPDELLAAILLKLGIDPYAALPNSAGISTSILPRPSIPDFVPLRELL